MKSTIQTILFALLIVFPVPSYAALDDYFVGTDWLAKNQNKVVVVDVRQPPLYYLGHIDGAYSVPRSSFLETRNQTQSLVPSAGAFNRLLSSLGVTPDTTVIAYAEDDNPYAARFIWTLRYHGHQKSFVLDGGYEKWTAEARTTNYLPTDSPKPSNYHLRANGDYLQARADADYIFTRLENPGVLVWDTRSGGEYKGTDVRADRGGHIPGAVHLNWTELQTEVNGVKVLKSREEIEALLAAYGLTADKEIVAHCQTGIRSSYATLVLLGLGYQRVKNYDGSWIEWANNPTLPIVNAQGELQSSVQISMTLTDENGTKIKNEILQ